MGDIIASSHKPNATGIRRYLPRFNPHRVRLISGRFLNLRRLLTWPLLILSFLTPWLTINELPLVHLDIAQKQFRFGEEIFWPEDMSLLIWVGLAAAFALFFVSMIAGRLWCGFSCPQSVWTFLFIRLEEMIEGSRNKRLKADRSPFEPSHLIRRVAKHISWLSLSLLTGITFVAWFYPLQNMHQDLCTTGLSVTAWFWISFFTLMTYLNAGFLREQVCTHMCPYSRFQSVMSDESTAVVHYDPVRGEPRRAPRKQDAGGDCVDCSYCVQVCPTGIDIRDGLQLACIACGACVDACDQVMKKLKKPTGLIAYRGSEQSGWSQRPRLIGYAVAFFISCAFGIHEFQARSDLGASLARDRNHLYSVNANDQLENHYVLKLHNKRNEPLSLQLTIRDAHFQAELNQKELTIAPSGRQQFSLVITTEDVFQTTDRNLIIEIRNGENSETLSELATSFLAPANLSAL